MTITIDLEPESEQRLREIAKAEGKEIAVIVKESVDAHLRKSRPKDIRKRTRELSTKRWKAEFDELINSYPRLDHPVDDNRESIYD